MLYIPKESMCKLCQNVKQDCSNLDFKRMQELESFHDIFIIVICNNFKRKYK